MSDNDTTCISVIVPKNPFQARVEDVKRCLCVLNVESLMEWWPGLPHTPHKQPEKVRTIQRSLDWKRVCQIAAYLLQAEIEDAPGKLATYFGEIYEPEKNDPGREWPPRVGAIVKYARSEYPSFSNVLVHINGGEIENRTGGSDGAAKLTFDPASEAFCLTVIDGQHRVNGAYLALKLLQEEEAGAEWEIPGEVFLDLDAQGEPPRNQAQVFIDVNFYQKKVDRSLVADLFPTARGPRDPLDDRERAQDIGRRLMLDEGPLVGMIQIPGIRYGAKGVVTLATLVAVVEKVLPELCMAGLSSLKVQTAFLSQMLQAWLLASGRKSDFADIGAKKLNAQNVVYQGRILVSVLSLVPAALSEVLRVDDVLLVSPLATEQLTRWLRTVTKRAGLVVDGTFISKDDLKPHGYLGSGGIGRFRDCLWASTKRGFKAGLHEDDEIAALAKVQRARFRSKLEARCE